MANFQITGYETDGRGDAEIGFELCLKFDRRGGFTLSDMESESKAKWLLRHRSLGGPKLLERNMKSDNDDEDNNEDNERKNTSDVPSFRSDRRIVRLLIARHFADVLQRAYLKEQKAVNNAEDKS